MQNGLSAVGASQPANHWMPAGPQSLTPNSETPKAPKTKHFPVTRLAAKHGPN